jgi:hypothetical protein
MISSPKGSEGRDMEELGTMTLREALTVLVSAHTRDDPDVGFMVLPTAELTFVEDSYPGAWEVVRKYLGFETEPQK